MVDLRNLLLSGLDGDPALITEQREVTFRELRSHVDQLGHALFEPFDRALAFCFLRNSAELCFIYLSAISLGHAVGLLPAATPPHRKRRLIAVYRPELVFLAPGELGSFMAESGYSPAAPSGLGGEIVTWVSRPAGGVGAELALLLSTSGSTGTPKLVRISADNIAGNVSGIVRGLRLSPAQRAVTSVPLCYSYGISILTSHLAAGSAVVVTDSSPLTRGFWSLVHRTAATTVGGTPVVHQAILGRLQAGRMPPSVRVMTQTGGRLPERAARDALSWAERSGGAFYCMYGQTEASRITILDAARLRDKLGSVGTPLPGGHVTVDPPRPGEAEGPISYTGPNVMLGYAVGRDDLVRGREVGTLDTGDLGHLDADGFLYIAGRSSRFAKLLDHRVSLDDIEEWFGPPGRVAAVAAGGGTVIVIFTTSDPAALEPVRQEIVGTLGAPASAVLIRQVAAIPKTVNVKVDYSALERRAELECTA